MTTTSAVRDRRSRDRALCKWSAAEPHTGTLLARHISGDEFPICPAHWEQAQHFDSIQLVGPLAEQRTRRDLARVA